MTPQTFSGGWKKLGECRVLQCADDDHPAGTTEEAGLPNITGNLNNALQTFSWSSTITAGSGAVQATAVGADTAVGMPACGCLLMLLNPTKFTENQTLFR